MIQYFSGFKLPRSKDFAVVQLLRSVASIGANIAEGYGRIYKKSYRQFLAISRGSSFESDYWFEVLIEFPDFDKRLINEFINQNLEIIKMLTVMMKRLERS